MPHPRKTFRLRKPRIPARPGQIIHGSRSRLARYLRGKTWMPRRLYRDPTTSLFDWNTDIFLSYPEPSHVHNRPEHYDKMHEFFIANKRDQWMVLKEFFKCPEIKDPPYVVRPLRHEGGVDFEITDTLPPEDKARTHYWRSLWERSCEYRVIFVYGKPVLTLLKRVPENTPQNIPWNAGVSSFVTVHDGDNDRLRHSKFYECAEKFFAAYPFHLVAVDVLYRKQRHRVVEVNFSPGVLIPDNLNLLLNQLIAGPTPHAVPTN